MPLKYDTDVFTCIMRVIPLLCLIAGNAASQKNCIEKDTKIAYRRKLLTERQKQGIFPSFQKERSHIFKWSCCLCGAGDSRHTAHSAAAAAAGPWFLAATNFCASRWRDAFVRWNGCVGIGEAIGRESLWAVKFKLRKCSKLFFSLKGAE